MLDQIITWLTDTIFRLGYPGIFALMAIESSFVPFPSEVVMPPAGFLAAQGRMNGWLALAAGTLGSVAGGLVNYFLAARLGRPLLHRFARRLLIKEASLERSEAFFRRHGEISTFIGRLIPVIRQYISLPAGLSGMNLGRFCAYTAAGAGIWCAVLTFIGFYLGRHAAVLQRDDVNRYATWAIIGLIPILMTVVGVYVVRQRRRGQGTAGEGLRTERAAGPGPA